VPPVRAVWRLHRGMRNRSGAYSPESMGSHPNGCRACARSPAGPADTKAGSTAARAVSSGSTSAGMDAAHPQPASVRAAAAPRARAVDAPPPNPVTPGILGE